MLKNEGGSNKPFLNHGDTSLFGDTYVVKYLGNLNSKPKIKVNKITLLTNWDSSSTLKKLCNSERS